MIPKTIHYCWFGPNEMSALHQACIATWRQKLPEYEIVRWDERNSPMEHPFVAYYYAKKKWAFVSDFVRLYVLYHHGGIYLDADVEVVRSFDPLLHHHLFIGYERTDRINSAICGARQGQPFVQACMEFMQKRQAKKLPYRIAPEVVTAVYKSGKYDEVSVLPPEAFYPYNPYDSGSVGQFLYCDVTPQTYAVHHWAKSWNMGMTERLLRKVL